MTARGFMPARGGRQRTRWHPAVPCRLSRTACPNPEIAGKSDAGAADARLHSSIHGIGELKINICFLLRNKKMIINKTTIPE